MNIRNLSYSYKENFTLDNINFSIKKGEIVGVIGSNGCGKSTLIRGIVGILPINGDIFLDEKKLRKGRDQSKLIAYLPQESNESSLNVYDSIMLGRIPYMGFSKKSQDKAIVEKLIVRFNLSKYKEREINTLSGGERQRVYLARLLAQESKVIVLDEPTSNLDMYNAYETIGLISSIVKDLGLRCIIVIHDLTLAGRYCDKLLLLKDGKQLAFGDKKSTFSSKLLEELYGIRLSIVSKDGYYAALPFNIENG